MSLTRDEALALQRRSLREWCGFMGVASEGAEVFEPDGVTAAIVPACPSRSIANSVTYDDPAALLDALDAVGERYERAGVEAWTVWVPDFERETAAALEARGHKFDGKPVAMELELDRWEAPELGDLDWDAEADGATFGRLNDVAYGIDADDGIAASLATPPDYVRLYQARVGGDAACVLGTVDHGGEDLGFYFVATDPEHRGEGLATRLMAVALRDARERGLRTSTLQASPLGEPVYRRLGYEPYFRLHMYERRKV